MARLPVLRGRRPVVRQSDPWPIPKEDGEAAEQGRGAVGEAPPSQPLRRLQRLRVRNRLQHAVVRLLHVLVRHLRQLADRDACLMNLQVPASSANPVFVNDSRIHRDRVAPGSRMAGTTK